MCKAHPSRHTADREHKDSAYLPTSLEKNYSHFLDACLIGNIPSGFSHYDQLIGFLHRMTSLLGPLPHPVPWGW